MNNGAYKLSTIEGKILKGYYNSDRLAKYYEKQKYYEIMKQYYLMGIEKGNINAMRLLAQYYKKNKDYENMKKYYMIAIEKGDVISILKKTITRRNRQFNATTSNSNCITKFSK